MNPKLTSLFFAVAMAFVVVFSASSSFAEDPKPADDPKLISEEKRMASPANTDAQFLAPGIECTTGSCYKDTVDAKGFNPTPTIDVDSAGKPKATKSGDTIE